VVGGGNYIEYQNLQDYVNPAAAIAEGAGQQGSGGNSRSASVAANLSALGAQVNSGSSGGSAGSGKRIIYGCTTLINANQVREITRQGHRCREAP